MDDTMESLDDGEEELEEEAQAEVDKVLWQITDGKLGQATSAVGSLPVRFLFSGSFFSSTVLKMRLVRLSNLRDRRQRKWKTIKKWRERSRVFSALDTLPSPFFLLSFLSSIPLFCFHVYNQLDLETDGIGNIILACSFIKVRRRSPLTSRSGQSFCLQPISQIVHLTPPFTLFLALLLFF